MIIETDINTRLKVHIKSTPLYLYHVEYKDYTKKHELKHNKENNYSFIFLELEMFDPLINY